VGRNVTPRLIQVGDGVTRPNLRLKTAGFGDQKSRPMDREVERTRTTGSLTSPLVRSTHLSERVSFLDSDVCMIVLLVVVNPANR
jgi:hypothetical protein